VLDADSALVAREAELETMATVLDSAAPWAVHVCGPAGIGKSRLLRELELLAEQRGHLVLHARAAEFDGGQPFGVLRDALDDWAQARTEDRRGRLAADDAAELATVLPAFEAGGHGGGASHERLRAYQAVRRLLSAIADEQPLLLILDDVHWADPASAELLAYLCARPPRGSVAMALGLRPARVAPLLDQALAAAVREDEARRLDLRPLAPEASRKLLGDAVPADVAAALHRESGGTPFFLLALAQAYLHGERPAVVAADDAVSVPRAVRAALAGELATLSPPALTLLRGAAVAGDPCDLRLAVRAAGIADADAPDLADAVLATALLTADAGQLAFRHPIVRATVLADAGRGWRAAAHARAASHLAAQGAPASARAPHVERSALPGDDEAITLLRQAADASLQRAPAQAARWYAAAASLVPEEPAQVPARIELRLAEATAAAAAGELDRGREALGAVLGLLPVDRPERVPVVASRAGIEHLLGRHRDAHAGLIAAHAAVAVESEGAVLLQVELAACAGFETRPAEMLEWAQLALGGAERLQLRALGAVAAGQVALAHYFLGRPAATWLEHAAARFAGLTDAELATRLDLGLWLGWTEAVLEQHEASLRTTDRVLRVSHETGQGATLLVTKSAAAWSLLRLGRLDRADAVLSGAVESGRLAPHLFLSVAVGQLALLRLAQGRLHEALIAGEESVRLARGADAGLIPGMSGFYAAAPLLEAGRHGAARDLLLDMSGGGRELRTSRSGDVPAYEILTRAALATGDRAAAEEFAGRAQDAAHDRALPAEDAHAQRAAAEFELARGDAAAAAERAAAAAERSAAAGSPIEAGRCATLAGRALAAAGRRDAAVTLLSDAFDGLVATGAHGWADVPDRELRRLGRRRRRVEPVGEAGLTALTERERQIAEMVRAGARNRQIANRLYVSEKTVERTLSTMFGKLGVRNRTALASLVEAGARGGYGSAG
jgi:DNA-binding CsgD family transcriptional regulator/tetratricopeptide (TPR) repeat protein